MVGEGVDFRELLKLLFFIKLFMILLVRFGIDELLLRFFIRVINFCLEN